jgi:hypothetical protein
MNTNSLPPLPLTKSQYGFDHTPAFTAQQMWDYARAALAGAQEAPAAAQYPLPDDLYAGSKDWAAGDYAQRVWWLHMSYEATKAERDELLRQLAQAGATGEQPQT